MPNAIDKNRDHVHAALSHLQQVDVPVLQTNERRRILLVRFTLEDVDEALTGPYQPVAAPTHQDAQEAVCGPMTGAKG